MKPIDDYDLIDQDYDEFLRRGREAFGIEEVSHEPAVENDGRRTDKYHTGIHIGL